MMMDEIFELLLLQTFLSKGIKTSKHRQESQGYTFSGDKASQPQNIRMDRGSLWDSSAPDEYLLSADELLACH